MGWHSSPLAFFGSENPQKLARAVPDTSWLLNATLSLLAAACGCGDSVSNPPPQPSAKEALYLSTGLSSGPILTYIFDTGTGTVGIPTPIAGPTAGIDMKVYPGGNFLYVSDFDSGSVFAYSIDRSTGRLTTLAGSPFVFQGHTGNGGPIAIDPAGKFLFSSNAVGAIVSFNINSQTGVLTPTTASAINDNNQPVYLLVDPTGKFLIASNQADSSGRNYSVFSINSTSAVLFEVQGSPFTFGQDTKPQQIALNSSGSVLYAALSNSQQVNALNFDSTTGTITAIQGAPYPAQSLPSSIVLLPNGQFLYAGNGGAGSISQYSVNTSTGALTTSNVIQANNPVFLDVDSSGQFLLDISESSNMLSVYKIDSATGVPTLLNNTNFPSGAGVRSASFLVPLQ
jgi:6-phosphogluconolactonase (cycloisomerase 2 family)